MKHTTFASLNEAVQTAKVAIADCMAQSTGVCPEDLQCMRESADRQFSWLQNQIDGLYRTFYSHLDGHLPALIGAERMSKALKALGLSGDFDVQKKVIYANTGEPNAVQFTLNLK